MDEEKVKETGKLKSTYGRTTDADISSMWECNACTLLNQVN